MSFFFWSKCSFKDVFAKVRHETCLSLPWTILKAFSLKVCKKKKKSKLFFQSLQNLLLLFANSTMDERKERKKRSLNWDMINCSKFDCSKTTGRHNFSTAQHHSSKCHFFVNWLSPVNLWGSTGFDQFHF
jgi:hypothetical protein